MPFTLVIGNKNYSSWSLRPWLLLKQSGIPFHEVRIPIRRSDSGRKIEKYSKAGRVPVLMDGKVTVWESLAICEYLAEKFPRKNLWPKDRAARALARSVSNEMHAGFMNLRRALPFNCRSSVPLSDLPEEVQADIDRVMEIWNICRKAHASKGPFLFGHFTVADAMYAPVCLRFQTYNIELDAVPRDYVKTILALPPIQEWMRGAAHEKEQIPELERKAD